MSKVEGWTCDTCGKMQADFGWNNMFRPAGDWYTLEIPPKGKSKHFCSEECLQKFVKVPVNILPQHWWNTVLKWWSL
jgi:hypothetical protein